MKKTALVLCMLLIIVTLMPAFSASAYTPTFDINAKSSLLINTDTGDVLYRNNTSERIYPASLSYLMVALVASEAAMPEDVVTVDSSVISSISGTGAIVANLSADEQITMGDLMRCMLMASDNDAALAIAAHITDSTEKFVAMMTAKAKELNLTDTQFVTPLGLTNEQQYTTVDDLYKLSKAAMSDKTISEILSTSRYTVPATNKSGERVLANTNWLIDRTTAYHYKYAVSGKTANSDLSGRCLVSTASYDGANYMCIVAGCDNSANARNEFKDTISFYKWAFTSFEYKTVVNKGEQLPVSAQVDLSWNVDNITLTAGSTIVALLPKDADLSTITYKVTLDHKVSDAPIAKGDKLGTASIIYANETIGQVMLVSGDNVERSITLLIWRWIKNIFSNIFVIIIAGVLIVAFIVLTITANVKASRARKKKLRLKKRL